MQEKHKMSTPGTQNKKCTLEFMKIYGAIFFILNCCISRSGTLKSAGTKTSSQDIWINYLNMLKTMDAVIPLTKILQEIISWLNYFGKTQTPRIFRTTHWLQDIFQSRQLTTWSKDQRQINYLNTMTPWDNSWLHHVVDQQVVWTPGTKTPGNHQLSTIQMNYLKTRKISDWPVDMTNPTFFVMKK